MGWLKKRIRKWYKNTAGNIKERPVRSIFFLIISMVLVFYTGGILYAYYGIFPLLGYMAFCLLGLADIIEKPQRALVWALGFALSAIAVGFFISLVLEGIQGGAIGLSVSGFVALAIMIGIFILSLKLRKY